MRDSSVIFKKWQDLNSKEQNKSQTKGKEEVVVLQSGKGPRDVGRSKAGEQQQK